jgi:midasin
LTIGVEEKKAYLEVHEHIEGSAAFLQQAAGSSHKCHIVFMPVLEWLRSQNIPLIKRDAPVSSATQNHLHQVVDTCLISMQKMLGCCTQYRDMDDEEPDNWLSDGNQNVLKRTSALNIPKMVEVLDIFMATIAKLNNHKFGLGQVLPFLDEYIEVARHQIATHCQWNKALLKFTFIVCTIVNNIAQNGFCKPPDIEESGDGGDEGEAVEGTGLGSGTGNENVSKVIEDESQVEGLQGENEDSSNAPKDPGGKDDTIEMSEDFGGELEDVPDDGEDEEARSDDDEGSQEDPDEGMGDLDQSDPDVVDEKLWGDQKGDEGRDSDKKVDQDRSQEQTAGESETVAKEGQGLDKRDQDSKENTNDPKPRAEVPEEDIQDEEAGGDDGQPDASGAPFEDHIPDANTLDLPDNLELGGEEKKDELDSIADGEDLGDLEDDVDIGADEGGEEPDGGSMDEDGAGDENLNMHGEEISGEQEDVQMDEEDKDYATGQADVSAGADSTGTQNQGTEKSGQAQESAAQNSASSGTGQGQSGDQGDQAMEEDNL